MNGLLNYIIEANIGLLIFMVCYRMLLHRETNFTGSRIFLLSGILASLIFPLVHLQDHGSLILSVGQTIPPYWLPEMVAGTNEAVDPTEGSIGFWKYAALLYCIGLATVLLRILVELTALLRLIHNAKAYRFKNLVIAESNEKQTTFSFFHFVFIGGAARLSPADKQQIIRHECVHARQWHSVDILLINFLKTIFWFNPLMNTYKKIFIQLHEFEADARTVEDSDPEQYCSLLARVALQSAGFTLANHFNRSLTVKRINMIRSAKTNISLWKLAVCTVVVPASFFLLSCQDQVGNGLATSDLMTTEVEEFATPQEGLEAFYNTIRRNLRYPAASRRNDKHGQVLVSFVVNEEGDLENMQVIASPDPLLSEEVIRVLHLSPKWNPAKNDGVSVKQQLILPLTFKLDRPGRPYLQDQEKPNSNVQAENALKEIVVVGYGV